MTNYELLNRIGYTIVKFCGDSVIHNGLQVDRQQDYFFSVSALYINIDDEIYNIYLYCNDSYLPSSNSHSFQRFLNAVKTNELFYLSGVEGFRPGKDYFLCEALYKRLQHTVNYMMTRPCLFDNWEVYDMTNSFNYVIRNNEIINSDFSEDELNNILATFFKLVLIDTLIDDETRNEIMNQVYNAVMLYYIKGFDDTSQNLALILGTSITTSLPGIQTCGCNTNGNTNTTGDLSNSQSCLDVYKTAMANYLKQMLSDPEYYRDWFNDNTCEDLIKLLETFLELNLNLDSTSNTNSNYNCPLVSSAAANCNKNTILNYIDLLKRLKDGSDFSEAVDINTNKIKIYGSEMADLLPQLVFDNVLTVNGLHK